MKLLSYIQIPVYPAASSSTQCRWKRHGPKLIVLYVKYQNRLVAIVFVGQSEVQPCIQNQNVARQSCPIDTQS